MQDQPDGGSTPSKPRSEVYLPGVVRLPSQNPGRMLFRMVIRLIARILIKLVAHCQVSGMENFPVQGPGLIVINHLGDADGILLLAVLPCFFDSLVKMDLYQYPVLGTLLDYFGVIWVHRGVADRNAITAALDAIKQDRLVVIAPEARESVTGALEQGTPGAAYLALKASAPIIPIAITGTENNKVVSNIKHLRRSQFTLTVGRPFRLPSNPNIRRGVEMGTKTIMVELAQLLPPRYRGVYFPDVKEATSQEKDQ